METLRQAAERAAEAAADFARIADEIATNAPEAAEAAGHGAAAVVGGATGIDPFMFQLSIFALACFVGYYVVWSVTPALHTPLMSVTNAISSVIVVGALVAVGADLDAGATWATRIFGFLGVILASVNIFGGFLVTERMLAMYKKKA
jgi:NAD(P) transhydrogenase subunit alpha